MLQLRILGCRCQLTMAPGTWGASPQHSNLERSWIWFKNVKIVLNIKNAGLSLCGTNFFGLFSRRVTHKDTKLDEIHVSYMYIHAFHGILPWHTTLLAAAGHLVYTYQYIVHTSTSLVHESTYWFVPHVLPWAYHIVPHICPWHIARGIMMISYRYAWSCTNQVQVSVELCSYLCEPGSTQFIP